VGMYTEFYFRCEIKKEKINEIKTILHKFDDNKILKGNSSSFPIMPQYSLHCHANEWRLLIHSQFKNYEDNIQKFLSTIKDCIDVPYQDFLGYYMYEEDETPTLIFYGDGHFNEDWKIDGLSLLDYRQITVDAYNVT